MFLVSAAPRSENVEKTNVTTTAKPTINEKAPPRSSRNGLDNFLVRIADQAQIAGPDSKRAPEHEPARLFPPRHEGIRANYSPARLGDTQGRIAAEAFPKQALS
jgi:hypothetical protein